MKDLKGREYARMSQLKDGDRVQVDGDFICIPPNHICTVSNDDGRLYIMCKGPFPGSSQHRHYLDHKGSPGMTERHYLDGQLSHDDENDDSLIGIYPA